MSAMDAGHPPTDKPKPPPPPDTSRPNTFADSYLASDKGTPGGVEVKDKTPGAATAGGEGVNNHPSGLIVSGSQNGEAQRVEHNPGYSSAFGTGAGGAAVGGGDRPPADLPQGYVGDQARPSTPDATFADSYLATPPDAAQQPVHLDFAIPVPADTAAANAATGIDAAQAVDIVSKDVAWKVGDRQEGYRTVVERPMSDTEAYNAWSKVEPDLARLTDRQFHEKFGYDKDVVTAAFADQVGRVRAEAAKQPKIGVDHDYQQLQHVRSGLELAGKMAESPAAAAAVVARMTRTGDMAELHKAADAGANVGQLFAGLAGAQRGAASDAGHGHADKAPSGGAEIRRRGFPDELVRPAVSPKPAAGPQRPATDPAPRPAATPGSAAPPARPVQADHVDRAVGGIKESEHPQPGRYVDSSRGTEAAATRGEATMGFAYGAKGYAFLDGPSGAGGHPWNAAGFDGVAFRTGPDGGLDVRIVDNKAFSRAGNVTDASAVTTNLAKNLDQLSHDLATSHYDQVPRIAELRRTIDTARDAAAARQPLPPNVHIDITTFGGRSTGVSEGLRTKGATYRGQDVP